MPKRVKTPTRAGKVKAPPKKAPAKKRASAAAVRAKTARAAERADSRKRAAAIASRKDSEALREIGELPEIVDPKRRADGEKSLRKFCETYFPRRFKKEFGKPHLTLIGSLQTIIEEGGLKAVALPRGYGKTTIVDVAAIWAVVSGRRRYVAEIAATGPLAKKRITAIKRELLSNDLLLEDFPEVCFPIRKLAGLAQRARGQTYRGTPTEITWGSSQIVLPSIDGSAASGAVIECGGLLSAVRGLQWVTTDGEILRPDLAILDDPQTRRSAKSRSQTEAREELVTGDLLYLAGHDTQIACVCCCTVIYNDDLADRLTDRKRNPEWQGQREKMLTSFPKHMDLWDQYGQLRKSELAATGKTKGSDEFYRRKRRKMDVGARVTWAGLGAANELSAIQHAMNLYLRNPDAFACEGQNEPVTAGIEEVPLTVAIVLQKQSELPRLIVPADALTVTSFIDVQKTLLYWAVGAYSSFLTGHLVACGTWPEQNRPYFTLANAGNTIQHALRSLGTIQAQILEALNRVTQILQSLPICRPDGKRTPIDFLMVDANWGETTSQVFQHAARSPIPCLPSHGRYYGARHKPIQFATPETGAHMGQNWIIPPIRPHRQTRAVTWDVNRWKTDFRRGIASPLGTPGTWTLYRATGDKEHLMLAEHLVAETATLTSGPYGELEEWTLRPGEDNHLLDCCIGTLVAASVKGISREGFQAPHRQQAKPKRSVRF